jgi:hypothetical protein
MENALGHLLSGTLHSNLPSDSTGQTSVLDPDPHSILIQV